MHEGLNSILIEGQVKGRVTYFEEGGGAGAVFRIVHAMPGGSIELRALTAGRLAKAVKALLPGQTVRIVGKLGDECILAEHIEFGAIPQAKSESSGEEVGDITSMDTGG